MMKIVALNALTKEDGEEQEETCTQVSKEAQVSLKFDIIWILINNLKFLGNNCSFRVSPCFIAKATRQT